MPKLIWDALAILASMLILIGGVASLTGMVFLSGMLWQLSPWLLVVTIPVGLGTTALIMAAGTRLLDAAIKRGR